MVGTLRTGFMTELAGAPVNVALVTVASQKRQVPRYFGHVIPTPSR